MSVTSLIQGIKPKNAAKWLEGELPDCSRRQAWRIIQTGKVPGRFRAALIDILKNALARNKAYIRRLEDELRVLEHQEMVARAAARRSEGDWAPDQTVARVGDRR